MNHLKKKHLLLSAHAITADVTLIETAKSAEFFSADGIILTGTATGDPADINELTGTNNLQCSLVSTLLCLIPLFFFELPYEKKSIGKYWIQYFFREFSILYREKSIRFNIYQYFFFIQALIFQNFCRPPVAQCSSVPVLTNATCHHT